MKSGVANRLRELRLRHGLTQEALAHDLAVSRHTILAIEVGRYVPSIGLALRIAAYFDTPLESIFWLVSGPDARPHGAMGRHPPAVTASGPLAAITRAPARATGAEEERTDA